MTGCWSGCWIGFTDSLRSARRSLYLTGRSSNRARYNEAKATVEFETLIDEDDCEFETAPSFTRHILTESEQQLVNQRKYDQLVEQQRRIDLQVDAKLQKDEDDLRLEEEAFYEARREAARTSRQTRVYEEKKSYQHYSKPKTPKLPDNTSLSSWLSDDGFSIDSAELDAEDFDSFLEKVKARSLTPGSKQSGVTTSTAVSNGMVNGSWEYSKPQTIGANKNPGKSLDAFKILDLSSVECDDRATDVER